MILSSPFLQRSVKGARWTLPTIDDHAVDRLRTTANVPELLARLLLARGVVADQIENFIHPTLSRDFPDPLALRDMEGAAHLAADMVMAGQTIGIFADFDVDGATSSAILVNFFRAINTPTLVHIPDRINEGYGPNTPALLGLHTRGAALTLICDCGITAHDILTPVAATGMKLIILDHHEPEATLPPADFIVDPKRTDDTSGFRMLCTAGLAFLFCVAVNRVLRARGFYSSRGITEPNMKDYLDLVAIGTVCDMVPLTGPNRVLTRAGMAVLQQRKNIGVAALARVSKIDPGDPMTVTHLGFGLGPRINAGSRVHQSDLGMRLLSSTDPVEAFRLAEILDQCNVKRREMEQATVQQAIKQVEAQGLNAYPVIVVDHPEWHPGVAGLVASRLKEKYGKPAAVVTYAKRGNGEVEGRGSGRSVKGFNIATLFQNARAAGHLIKGGGHAMAGGFSLRPDQLESFRDFVRHEGAALAADIDPTPEQTADALALVPSLNVAVARILDENLGPYGMEHPEPLFIIPSVRIARVDVLGNAHVRAMITDVSGGMSVKAMAFRAAESEMGQILRQTGDQPVHILGRLGMDRWQGRETPVVTVEDVGLVAETAAIAKRA